MYIVSDIDVSVAKSKEILNFAKQTVNSNDRMYRKEYFEMIRNLKENIS